MRTKVLYIYYMSIQRNTLLLWLLSVNYAYVGPLLCGEHWIQWKLDFWEKIQFMSVLCTLWEYHFHLLMHTTMSIVLCILRSCCSKTFCWFFFRGRIFFFSGIPRKCLELLNIIKNAPHPVIFFIYLNIMVLCSLSHQSKGFIYLLYVTEIRW